MNRIIDEVGKETNESQRCGIVSTYTVRALGHGKRSMQNRCVPTPVQCTIRWRIYADTYKAGGRTGVCSGLLSHTQHSAKLA